MAAERIYELSIGYQIILTETVMRYQVLLNHYGISPDVQKIAKENLKSLNPEKAKNLVDQYWKETFRQQQCNARQRRKRNGLK